MTKYPYEKKSTLSSATFLIVNMFVALLVLVQAFIYFKKDDNILLSICSDDNKNITFNKYNRVYAIEISTLYREKEGTQVKINGMLYCTLCETPVIIYLQRGDVLELDSYNRGYCVINITMSENNQLPKGWNELVIIENMRLRLPPVY